MKIVKIDRQAEINQKVRELIESDQIRLRGWGDRTDIHPSNRERLARLEALGQNPTATVEELNSAYGGVFSFSHCEECGGVSPTYVVLAEDACEECGGALLCPDCLRKALTLVEASL